MKLVKLLSVVLWLVLFGGFCFLSKTDRVGSNELIAYSLVLLAALAFVVAVAPIAFYLWQGTELPSLRATWVTSLASMVAGLVTAILLSHFQDWWDGIILRLIFLGMCSWGVLYMPFILLRKKARDDQKTERKSKNNKK